jgi:hypothetical protein
MQVGKVKASHRTCFKSLLFEVHFWRPPKFLKTLKKG